ncbi:hypothetical protein VTL71DRAFT_835 [Oculimacula yallundae]|uniref:Uncharacterized protein n=1 Tax=Oculimacula yallundae TaxID=86028 RepID=A0ABR4D181_9HELO
MSGTPFTIEMAIALTQAKMNARSQNIPTLRANQQANRDRGLPALTPAEKEWPEIAIGYHCEYCGEKCEKCENECNMAGNTSDKLMAASTAFKTALQVAMRAEAQWSTYPAISDARDAVITACQADNGRSIEEIIDEELEALNTALRAQDLAEFCVEWEGEHRLVN